MRFFQNKDTKELHVAVDDSALSTRLSKSDSYEELTNAKAKKALGKQLENQPASVQAFLASDGEEAQSAPATAPAQ